MSSNPAVGEILNLFAKIKKKGSTAESAYYSVWVGTIRRESTREERGEISREKKNARHEPYWVGGEKSLICDPGSELRLGGRE